MTPSLLSLPPEIRLQIYGLIFSEIHASPPQPLQIWQRKRLGWRIYSRISQSDSNDTAPIPVTQLLRASRQIYTEALPVLYAGLSVGGPTLAIQCGLEPLHMACTWEEYHGLLGYERRDVREVVAPILRGVRRMGMAFGVEVEVVSGVEEQVHVMGLLRWVRAMVNLGDSERDYLEGLRVGEERVGRVEFAYLGWRGIVPRSPSGLWEVLRDWKCEEMQAEYRYYNRHQPGTKQETEDREKFDIPEPSRAAMVQTRGDAAWSAMEAARLRTEKMSVEHTNVMFPRRRLVFDCVGGSTSQLVAWMRRRR